MIWSDLTTKEASRMVTICYTQQQLYPESFAEYREFAKLAVLGGNLHVEFTAAGFFEINRTTLYKLICVVTTYFIVIVQFRKK